MKNSKTHPDLRFERGARARTEILLVAERIFAEAGLEGSRMEAIAAGAGVNKALLYYYFKSKEALFRAVMEDVLTKGHQRSMALLARGGSPRETLLRYLGDHFDAISSHPDYCLLFMRFMMSDTRLARRLIQKLFLPRSQKVAALIRQGIRRGEFRAVDSRQTALSLNALIVFYFTFAPMLKALTSFDPFRKANLEKRKREILDFVRHALFVNPEAERL